VRRMPQPEAPARSDGGEEAGSVRQGQIEGYAHSIQDPVPDAPPFSEVAYALATAVQDPGRAREISGYTWTHVYGGDRSGPRADEGPPSHFIFDIPAPICYAWRHVTGAYLREVWGLEDVGGDRTQWFHFAYDDASRRAWCLWYLRPPLY
jgi:hypothetical protein